MKRAHVHQLKRQQIRSGKMKARGKCQRCEVRFSKDHPATASVPEFCLGCLLESVYGCVKSFAEPKLRENHNGAVLGEEEISGYAYRRRSDLCKHHKHARCLHHWCVCACHKKKDESK